MRVVLIILLFFGMMLFSLRDLVLPSDVRPTVRSQKEVVTPTGGIDYQVTIEGIFQEDKSRVAALPKEQIITLIATGDVIPARTVNTQAIKYNSFTWAFEKTADMVRNADITFINLETPILRNCPVTNEGFTFCGDSRHVEGLRLSGVDVATLGNNHAGNYGKDGVAETTQILRSNGIDVTGIPRSNIVYKTIRGVTFAFLGYTDIEKVAWVANVEEETIRNDIQEARRKADVVIVQFHWGAEYQSQPDQRQQYLGHFTIDNGADLVIGNHPHWIQPVEIYKGKLVTYAHGNFVFDQMWSQKTREGVIGKYTFIGKKLVDVTYTPIQIVDFGQAQFVTNEAHRKKILQEMKEESLILAK